MACVVAETSRDRKLKMFAAVTERIGEPKTWPKDPDAILALLDQLFKKNIDQDDPQRRINDCRHLRSRAVPDADQ